MVFALFSSALWALDVRTTVNSIAHEGNNQTLGIFTLVVDNNAFPNASPSNPVYIRFRLIHANGWSNSLVDLRPDAHDSVDQPINLAIVPPASGVALNPTLSPETIQLVRFIKGEREGWLKITQPTSSWLSGGGSPTPENSVSVTVGIRGNDSIQNGTNTNSGGNEFANTGQPASTVLRADYRNTPLFGNGDTEILDFIGFDSSTRGVENDDTISTGSILSFGFSNDLIIARGTFNFPCLDYHFAPENFEAPAHLVAVSRINLVNFREYEFNIPPVYLSNTSDFPWDIGTNLFLTLPYFETDFALAGVTHPGRPDENAYPVQLVGTSITATAVGGSEWEIQPVFWGELLAGFRFILTGGLFGINDRLSVEGLRGKAGENFSRKSLSLAATAYYRNEQVTFGELKQLGPIQRRTVDLTDSQPNFSRKVVPYTAYDREDFDFKLHLTNPQATPLIYTALFYNRHGILLRILGNQTLDPHTKRTMDIGDLFGSQAQGILSWVEILSEQNFQAVGEIRNPDSGMLDIFPANAALQQNLFGIHLPSQIQTWQTTAYVLSADLSTDTEFNMTLPEADPFRINNIFLPGGTARISDGNFLSQEGRQPWFQVQTSNQSGAGLLFYEQKQELPQLVSVLMNLEPSRTWRYDHLGSRESGWWNGLVLFNPTDEDIRITIRGLREDSFPLGETQLTLAAKSKYIGLASQMVPNSSGQAISMLQATSNSKFLSFLLLGREEQAVLTRISGNLPESKEFALGYLPKSEDEWLGISLFNPQLADQTAQLTLFDENGEPGPSESVILPQLGKTIFNVNSLFGDISAYNLLKIESQAPIRAFGITGDHAGTILATIDPEPITQ